MGSLFSLAFGALSTARAIDFYFTAGTVPLGDGSGSSPTTAIPYTKANLTTAIGNIDGSHAQVVQRATIWSPNGGDSVHPASFELGMPSTCYSGVNSNIRGISMDVLRDADGGVIPNANGDPIFKVIAVGTAESSRSEQTQIGLPPYYIGTDAHAAMFSLYPSYNDISGNGATSVDLNDPTLVKSVPGVLTNAIAVNRAGYILAQSSDGGTYLLVPLIY